MPDPNSTDNPEFQIVLGLIRDGLKKDPTKWTRYAEALQGEPLLCSICCLSPHLTPPTEEFCGHVTSRQLGTGTLPSKCTIMTSPERGEQMHSWASLHRLLETDSACLP